MFTVLLAFVLLGLVQFSSAYHAQHFQSLRTFLQGRPDLASKIDVDLNTLFSTSTKRAHENYPTCNTRNVHPDNVRECNSALWSAMGTLNATAYNYLQYNSTTAVLVNVQQTVQQKYWDYERNAYVDTYQVWDGQKWSQAAFYWSRVDPASLDNPIFGARVCSTSNDTVLSAFSSIGVQVSPSVQVTNWINATSGQLFASEMLTTTNSDPAHFQRDVTFKTLLGTGVIYVTQITQVRVNLERTPLIPTGSTIPPNGPPLGPAQSVTNLVPNF
jgi:hypothetical protein